jgi:trimeric autotransporter adhesin
MTVPSGSPGGLFFDNRTSSLYVAVSFIHLVFIYPGNRTIPPNGVSLGTCSVTGLKQPQAIAVDSVGNTYIASLGCNWVMKWTSNDTSGTIIAGSLGGSSGSGNMFLTGPRGLFLDELNSVIYISDYGNQRVQRVPLDGTRVGVTVAGGNGIGSAANKLNGPSDLYRSTVDGYIYICDNLNNRIQKWVVNGTTGVTVVGSSTGASGSSPYLLNGVGGLAFSPNETFLYVADKGNNRVQRFRIR